MKYFIENYDTQTVLGMCLERLGGNMKRQNILIK